MIDLTQRDSPQATPETRVLRFATDLVCHLHPARASAVRDAFARTPPGASVVVDFEDVSAIDAVGIGALVGGVRHVRHANGTVLICRANSAVSRTLSTSGVSRIVRVVSTFEDQADSSSAEFARSASTS